MPYGETRVESGQRLDLGYTGHKWDAETKQYHAPYRYYSSANSRWLSRDPLGFVDGPNVYGYVNNTPSKQAHSGSKGIMVTAFCALVLMVIVNIYITYAIFLKYHVYGDVYNPSLLLDFFESVIWFCIAFSIAFIVIAQSSKHHDDEAYLIFLLGGIFLVAFVSAMLLLLTRDVSVVRVPIWHVFLQN